MSIARVMIAIAYLRFGFVFVLVSWVLPHGFARSDDSRYCGIYSIYAASHSLGVPVHFTSLLSPEYVSGFYGSTAGDLALAIEQAGLQSQVVRRASWITLRDTAHPVILHVFSEGQVIAYNHWILFLGTDGSHAIIVDGRSGAYHMPIQSLLAQWDGTAIFVLKRGDMTNYGAKETSRWLWWLALCLTGVTALYSLSRQLNRVGIGVQMAVVTGVIMLGGMAYWHSTVGLGTHRETRRYLEAAIDSSVFGRLTIEEIFALHEGHEVILIDARYADDAQRGMLPNAINVPVNASTPAIESTMNGVPSTARLVVYCQSAGCQFGTTVAARLTRMGYRDITLLKGGWLEWQAYQRERRQGER